MFWKEAAKRIAEAAAAALLAALANWAVDEAKTRWNRRRDMKELTPPAPAECPEKPGTEGDWV